MACPFWKLIPTVTIYPATEDYGKFWHAEIKCAYPSNIDEKEKLKLMEEVRRECSGHCKYEIDKDGLFMLVRLLFSEEFQNKHVYIAIPKEPKTEHSQDGGVKQTMQ